LIAIDKLLQILPLRTKQRVNNGAMARTHFALLFLLALGSAWAQPAQRPQSPASQGLTEQRRVELRHTLKAQVAQEMAGRSQTTGTPSPHRHLSEQERADLRQQLRAQRPVTQPDRP
jgi:hypothetical protein